MTEQREKQLPAEERARRWGEVAVVCLLAAAAVWLCLSGNWGSEFWWNDAARHAMDGVFFLDLVRDLPESLAVKQYAVEYYARYPCLGLIHYPPVFPVVEALFFALLGVSVETARITVAAFAVGGVVFGYLLGRRFLGRWGAALFVLFFITAPGVVFWSRDVMLETPMLAMMLASSYYFVRYVDDERRGAGVAAAILLALAVLTKQNAGALTFVWVGYALWRRGRGILRRKESLLGAAIVLAILAPYVLLTVKYAPLNVGQSIGGSSGEFRHSRWSFSSVRFYLDYLRDYATVPCFVGIGLLPVVALLSRKARQNAAAAPWLRGVVFAILWAVVCYVLFTFVIAIKESRHILAWSPALALLGASGFVLLARRGWPGRVVALAVTALAAGQALACGVGWRHDLSTLRAPYVEGTQGVARRLAALPRGTVVFYGGNFNGNFIFNLRRFDPTRKVVILRASKLLFSMPSMQEHGLTVHASSREEILKLLRDYGVRFLLVEDKTPALDKVDGVMDLLRRLAASDLFKTLGAYPIASTSRGLARRLVLYEFREPRPARVRMLNMNIPMGGRRIRVPLHRLGVRVKLPKERKDDKPKRAPAAGAREQVKE